MKLLLLSGLASVHATISCYKGMVFYFDHTPYPKERQCNTDYPVNNPFNPAETIPNMDCIRASHVEAARYHKDGYLKVNDATGLVHAVADTDAECDSVKDYSGKLITPGFLDCHNHWPQIDMVASFGGDLIEWLKTYTFKAEARNIDDDYAAASAKRFFNILVRSGTTSTLAFNVIFKGAVKKFFEEANKRNIRMISGLNGMSDCADSEYPVMLDKGTGDGLESVPLCNSLDFEDVDGSASADKFLEDSEALIEEFFTNKPDTQRSEYAIIPRFLLSSTPALMEAVKTLHEKYPEMKFHTHMSENLGTSVFSVFEFGEEADVYYGPGGKGEDAAFLTLVKSKKTKFEIWDAYGLIYDKSTWGHSIHMTESDLQLAKQKGAKPCHCPASNLFLGSGLFDMKTHIEMDIEVGLGSDVGAGTTYEMLRVAADMYKIAMMPGSEAASIPPGTKGQFNDWFNQNISNFQVTGSGDPHVDIPYKRKYKPYPLSQLYLLTLGTANVMGVDDKIGSFKTGMEADFVVTDTAFSPIYNWNKKVTDDFQMDGIRKEATDKQANFTEYAGGANSLAHVTDLADYLYLEKIFFPLVVLSDDRTNIATYIMGKQAYDRELHYHLSLDEDYSFEPVATTTSAPVACQPCQEGSEDTQKTSSAASVGPLGTALTLALLSAFGQ